MSKKAPAFQFYPAEFLSDENVVLMSNQALGCYIKLMCYCWREGSIPAQIPKIAKLCGEDSSAMAELWAQLEGCFELSDLSTELSELSTAETQRMVHGRLERERIKQSKYSLERSESGKKGAEVKRRIQQNQTLTRVNSSASSSASSSATKELQAIDSSSSSSSSSILNTVAVAQPDGVSDLVWKDFRKLRKDKKAAVTLTAMEGIQREATAAGYTLERALTTCCERGWTGFKADWVADKPGGWQANVVPITMPSRSGVDPALAKAISDSLSAKGPSPEIREKMRSLSRPKHG